jgi:hypothetical protein
MSLRIYGIGQSPITQIYSKYGTYTLLEGGNLIVGEGVGLGDHRNEVDLGVQTAHDLDIERLERVTSGLDEVDAGVDAVVDNVHAVHLVLGIQVGVETLLDVLGDWAPGVVVVDKVTETRSVDNGQAQADAVFLDICADCLDVDGLGSEVEGRLLALLGRVKGGVEKGVDQGGLSEAGLTWMELVSLRICNLGNSRYTHQRP